MAQSSYDEHLHETEMWRWKEEINHQRRLTDLEVAQGMANDRADAALWTAIACASCAVLLIALAVTWILP